jgi:hypothetical protein
VPVEPGVVDRRGSGPDGPMAEFDEAAVLAWVDVVPGLTVAQRAAARGRVEEDAYDGGAA